MLVKVLYIILLTAAASIVTLVSYSPLTFKELSCSCEHPNVTTTKAVPCIPPPPSPTLPPTEPPTTPPTEPPTQRPTQPPTQQPPQGTTGVTASKNGPYSPKQTNRNSTGLVVLGMHRSGTSMMTGAISVCLKIPTSSPEMSNMLMGGNRENAKGYFERRDLLHLNIFMLEQLKQNSDGYTNLVLTCSQSQLEEPHGSFLIKPAIKYLIDDLNQYDTWIIKEPRMTLTYGYYHKSIPNPVFIIPVRHPLEVVKSLVARSIRTSPRLMFEYWENYIYNALRYSMGQKRIFLFHNEFLSSVNSSLVTMYQELKSMGVVMEDIPLEEINQCGQGWVDGRLVHHKQEMYNLDTSLRIGRETLTPEMLSRFYALYDKLKSGEAKNWKLTDLPFPYQQHPYNCTNPPPQDTWNGGTRH